jgi:ABC-type nitrate/sulfonate/bicarbonate transport system ATPase subunit
LVSDVDDGEKPRKVFIGRDKEINEILQNLDDNKSNSGAKLLLVGESGIGKSALLDELYKRLTEQKADQRNRPFVGYYSKKESLIAESESLIYPFNVVLENLVKSAKEPQQLGSIPHSISLVTCSAGLAIFQRTSNKYCFASTIALTLLIIACDN